MNARMRLYSPREVATQLGLHPRTIQREVARGHLEAVRSPSGYFMAIADHALDLWLTEGNGKRVLAHALHCQRRSSNLRTDQAVQGKAPRDNDSKKPK